MIQQSIKQTDVRSSVSNRLRTSGDNLFLTCKTKESTNYISSKYMDSLSIRGNYHYDPILGLK